MIGLSTRRHTYAHPAIKDALSEFFYHHPY